MVSKGYLDLWADKWLANHPDVYAVDSIVVRGLSYTLKDDVLSVVRGHDVRSCKLHEADELVRCCLHPELAEELKAVIEDMLEYRGSGREIVVGKRIVKEG